MTYPRTQPGSLTLAPKTVRRQVRELRHTRPRREKAALQRRAGDAAGDGQAGARSEEGEQEPLRDGAAGGVIVWTWA